MKKEILTSILAGVFLGCSHAPKKVIPEWINQEAYQSENRIFVYASGKSNSENGAFAYEDAVRNAIKNASEKIRQMRSSYSRKGPIRPLCSPWKKWRDGWASYAQVRCDYTERVR